MSWAEQHLGNYVVNGEIILETGLTVSVDTFEQLFVSAIEAGGSYQDFVNVDAGSKGYKKYLDKWHSEGLI